MSDQKQENQNQPYIDSEQLFDMLPYVSDIYDKIKFDQFRKELQKKYKGKKNVDSLDPAIEATKFILKNSGKSKKSSFKLSLLQNVVI